jgi:hypothetical protein
MKLDAAQTDRGPVMSAAVSLAAVTVLALTIPLDLPIFEVSVVVAGTVLAALAYRTLLDWQSLLAFTILVILFIPIKRYELPGNLPFDLEPYRLVVMLLIAAWASSLLIDPRVRMRASGFEGPILLVIGASVASVIVNPGRVASLGVEDEVVKGLMFLLSFFLVFYVIVSLTTTRKQLDFLIQTLVGGTAIVGCFAVVEARTGYNVFEHLEGIVPFLSGTDLVAAFADERGGRLRVYASGQSPIALGAAFIMVVPLGVYLARRTGRILWWGAAALLVMGALSTLTRTSVAMLIPLGLAFLWLRPRETLRMWPLVIPLVCVTYFALPGAIGTIRGAFFPAGGIIAEQKQHAGYGGSGRIADLDPALAEWARQPVFGQGYSTRQTGRENRQTQILDNQWLKTLLETGVVGTLAWVWLFARYWRRLGKESRYDVSDRGVLLVALVASTLSFAVGMFFYDAFSFIQVTFLAFIVLAFGAVALRLPPDSELAATPVQTSTHD